MSNYDDPDEWVKFAVVLTLFITLSPLFGLLIKHAWNQTMAAIFGLPRIDWAAAMMLLGLRLMFFPLR